VGAGVRVGVVGYNARVAVGRLIVVGAGIAGVFVLTGGRRVGVVTAINSVAEGWRVAVALGKITVGELGKVGVAGGVTVGAGGNSVADGASVGNAVGLAIRVGVTSGLA
jgi:hypothetical protein